VRQSAPCLRLRNEQDLGGTASDRPSRGTIARPTPSLEGRHRLINTVRTELKFTPDLALSKRCVLRSFVPFCVFLPDLATTLRSPVDRLAFVFSLDVLSDYPCALRLSRTRHLVFFHLETSFSLPEVVRGLDSDFTLFPV